MSFSWETQWKGCVLTQGHLTRKPDSGLAGRGSEALSRPSLAGLQVATLLNKVLDLIIPNVSSGLKSK